MIEVGSSSQRPYLVRGNASILWHTIFTNGTGID